MSFSEFEKCAGAKYDVIFSINFSLCEVLFSTPELQQFFHWPLGPKRIKCIIEDQAFSLSCDWAPSSSSTPLPSPSCLSFSGQAYWRERAGGGRGKEPIIRRRESLALYNPLTTYSLIGTPVLGRPCDRSRGTAGSSFPETGFRVASRYCTVLYWTLLHLPPLRFRCVEGCRDRTQDCCDFGIGSQKL